MWVLDHTQARAWVEVAGWLVGSMGQGWARLRRLLPAAQEGVADLSSDAVKLSCLLPNPSRSLQTAFGRRLLRSWVGKPLRHRPSILARLDAVQELAEQGEGLAGSCLFVAKGPPSRLDWCSHGFGSGALEHMQGAALAQPGSRLPCPALPCPALPCPPCSCRPAWPHPTPGRRRQPPSAVPAAPRAEEAA